LKSDISLCQYAPQMTTSTSNQWFQTSCTSGVISINQCASNCSFCQPKQFGQELYCIQPTFTTSNTWAAICGSPNIKITGVSNTSIGNTVTICLLNFVCLLLCLKCLLLQL
jgi:hypothetical protein